MNLTKEYCEEKLKEGWSIRKIGRINNIPNKTVQYWTIKWNLLSNYNKPNYNEEYFKKIDTKEKAYLLGFLLGDSSLSNECLELSLAKSDIEILKLLSNEIGSNITIDNTYVKSEKRFPRVRTSIGNRIIIDFIKKLFGGLKKEDRHIPIINKELKKYLLLGFFDAEGCITYGIRKDRNIFWGKVYFTSQLKMLEGIQNILIDENISSTIKKRTKENCYDLYIRTNSFYKTIKLLNIPELGLKRKQEKINALLRQELG